MASAAPGEQKSRRRKQYRRLHEFWTLYKESKMGMTGLIILIFFLLLAIVAPVLQSAGVVYDPSPLNRIAAEYSKPFWTSFEDPTAFGTTQVLPNPTLETTDGWRWSDTPPNYAGGFDPLFGANPGSGPGSYYLTFTDESPTSAYLGQTGYIETSFVWNHKPPADATIQFNYILETTGSFELTDFELKLIAVSANGTEVVRPLFRPYPTEWKQLLVDWNAFEYSDIFNEQGQIAIRWVMTMRTVDSSKTGTVTLWVDDARLTAHSSYFGIMGTTDSGADLFSQIVWGTWIALSIGILATVIAIGIGTVIGLVSGYTGGIVDEVIVFITLFLNILPGLVLLLVLASLIGPSFWNIIWIIAFLGWTGVTLIVRAQTRSERNKAYVMSARAIGASDIVILFRHILPNVTPLLFAIAGPSVAGAILAEAALSFLGISDPTVVSWGKILQRANDTGAFSRGAWWTVVFPGAFLSAISISFVFIGYTIDRILNPRLRQR